MSPILPENKGRYSEDWAGHLSNYLSDTEVRAASTISSSLGFDPSGSGIFWEHVIARIVAGRVTEHRAPHDVEVFIWGKLCSVEVKFSTAHWCRFSEMKGHDVSRRIFRWAGIRCGAAWDTPDATVLIGRDVDGRIYFWVFPPKVFPRGRRTMTLTAISDRRSGHGRMDSWMVPSDQVLPAVARMSHNRYDAEHRRQTRARRQREALRDAGQGEMF